TCPRRVCEPGRERAGRGRQRRRRRPASLRLLDLPVRLQVRVPLRLHVRARRLIRRQQQLLSGRRGRGRCRQRDVGQRGGHSPTVAAVGRPTVATLEASVPLTCTSPKLSGRGSFASRPFFVSPWPVGERGHGPPPFAFAFAIAFPSAGPMSA